MGHAMTHAFHLARQLHILSDREWLIQADRLVAPTLDHLLKTDDRGRTLAATLLLAQHLDETGDVRREIETEVRRNELVRLIDEFEPVLETRDVPEARRLATELRGMLLDREEI